MGTSTVLAVLLNGRPHVIAWGWLQITLANLIVIILMAVVFVAALVLPFPRGTK